MSNLAERHQGARERGRRMAQQAALEVTTLSQLIRQGFSFPPSAVVVPPNFSPAVRKIVRKLKRREQGK